MPDAFRSSASPRTLKARVYGAKETSEDGAPASSEMENGCVCAKEGGADAFHTYELQ